VDDPYEPPSNPEVVVETDRMGPRECLERIVAKLEELGYLKPHPS
jgi:adenylylsulfate kinase-like enzyme